MRLALVLLLSLSLLALCNAAQYQTHPHEVAALKAVKGMLIDPMKNLRSWSEGDPCDSWIGVSCNDTVHDDGYLHLWKLQLMNMNLEGNLSSELGKLPRLKILNFMWNKIGGSIPKEIGNLRNLELLLLSGNQLTGSLPDELGYLPNITRMQINLNKISGALPKSLLNLANLQHFHLNNNSITGEIPHDIFSLPKLIHFVLDNNDLLGSLPELSNTSKLKVLQLDNNNHLGGDIPASYGSMTTLIKLSLRNCSLQGSIPDLSRILNLHYIDLSLNKLSGSIPSQKLAENMTTILLSHNNLNGNIPPSFSSLPRLQNLSLDNNELSGHVPDALWRTRKFNGQEKLILDFRNNALTEINGSSSVPPNVTLMLEGNYICSNRSIAKQYCANHPFVQVVHTPICSSQGFIPPYEVSPPSPTSYGPARPLIVYFRLESPLSTDFNTYRIPFENFLTGNLRLGIDQLNISCIIWQEGPRLGMILELFPIHENGTKKSLFNSSEVQRIWGMFSEWKIPNDDVFGPYELLYFEDPYKSGDHVPFVLTAGALVGIILGNIVVAVALAALVSYLIVKRRMRRYIGTSRRHRASNAFIQVKGVIEFTYKEMARATSNFCISTQIGQGGYGNVYKGTLVDGTLVAIKRAKEGSVQGIKEFSTEIELLSRLHHRHLVSLLGYCDDKGDQMLVYEFIPNGTLSDHLSARSKQPLSFATRLKIALGSARGIFYLHTEADPPIFHRDVKATNILLDTKFTAKVADFGLSRIAPEPSVDGSAPVHVSTMVKGTPGYLDPEYFMTHMLTDKSDVYGLGVVFLELLTGMQPISQGKNIVREVSTGYQYGNLFSLIDERMGAYDHECVARFANLALVCCHEETNSRPTMAEVVRELEDIIQMIPESDTILATESSYNGSRKRDLIASSASSSHNPCMDAHLSESCSISRSFTYVDPR